MDEFLKCGIINGVTVFPFQTLPPNRADGVPLELQNANGGNVVSLEIYGNSIQDSVPTTTAPVQIRNVGDLVTSGERAGEFAITINSSGDDSQSIDTTIYLSEPLRKGDILETVNGRLTRRRRAIDLGTMNYSFYSGFFICTVTGKASGVTNMMCANYAVKNVGLSALVDGECRGDASGGAVYFKDSRYTTAAAFKSAMSGVVLEFELATPTESEIEPQNVRTVEGDSQITVSTATLPETMTAEYIGAARPLI